MKVQVKRALKSYFFVIKRRIKKQTGSAWNFLQFPIQMCRGAYIPYFKINAPIFCCSIFLEECLNPQFRINKMLNEHTVDYQPSPLELTSRIQPLIFLWTSKGFISQEYFLNFSQTCISHHGCGKFQILGVKITGKYICELKNLICLSLLMYPNKTLPQVVIITTPL